jgi:hypothetical protein
MDHIVRDIMRLIDRMGPQEWLYALVAVVFVGILCLRGFGSRSSY